VTNRGRCLLLSVLALGLGACQHVAPYQRARLAHPTMVDEFSSVGAAHMVAIHEGAMGGGSAGEAGCGCN
jgi:hypothetical protein